MPLTGDFDELDQLIHKFDDLESGQAKRDLCENLAEESVSLVQDGFDEQRDPWGNAWAALKCRSGRILRLAA